MVRKHSRPALVTESLVFTIESTWTKMYGPPRDCKRIVEREIVCANVFVNKGEGVVKDKHVLFVA
jgi:hypothetical protein